MGNLCKGPSAAPHPSSQVTEFVSLIIGGNRKAIGMECCHRTNVSQLQINVSASWTEGSRKTVASKRCLSGTGRPSAPAHLQTASPEDAPDLPSGPGPGVSPMPEGCGCCPVARCVAPGHLSSCPSPASGSCNSLDSRCGLQASLFTPPPPSPTPGPGETSQARVERFSRLPILEMKPTAFSGCVFLFRDLKTLRFWKVQIC